MNKRGIELSVNFLVMLILAIVVFGFGIKLVYSMFSSSMNKIESLDQNSEQQIMSMLSSGKKVAIPIYKKTTVRGKPVVFGVGIYNSLEGQGSDDEFVVRVGDGTYNAAWTGIHATYPRLFNPDGTEVTDTNKRSKVSLLEPFKATKTKTATDGYKVNIQKNKGQVVSIPVSVDKNAEAGTYVFDVFVCAQSFSGSYDIGVYGDYCNARKINTGHDYGDPSTLLNTEELYDNSVHQIIIEVR
ncbi:hypothetical protein J4460_08505 [Candidatus Woesearchaeota archaeon]|nr:MAG: hypothetical protein QS99_C0013G0001 [archaeon GW2011_AR4]MBS3130679.1 hypothetical protein [Candidatus Woesearchaeota archaeon]HIH37473.1 hypothetical protein [Candidatus Woesearchaeota archaeon]HIH48927.1 hypothetical protein [Candidatus Woesearchaeota archaeon]HIJ04364.1 hypothetical protein [Candidatus Woesearchaeota archaeon]